MTNVIFVPPSTPGSDPFAITVGVDADGNVTTNVPGLPGAMVEPDAKPMTRVSETLKRVVDKQMEDPKFVGLAKFCTNIQFAWSTAIDTACAGHGFIFYNPHFYMSLPEETQKTVTAHEIWHLILKHLERGKLVDGEIHNWAADHVINLGLIQDGFTWEEFQPLADPKYNGMSTEQVYNILYAEEQKKPRRPKGDGKNGLPGTPDPNAKPEPGMGGTTPTADQIEDMIEDILNQEGDEISLDEQKSDADKEVDKHSEACGNQAGNSGIRLDLTQTMVPIIGATYQKIFEDYLIDPLSGGKRTFVHPNRRQVGMKGSPLRLPGRFPKRGHINRLTHLVYALDVSGSISQKMAQQFHDSVRNLKDVLNPEKLTVLFFDTRIVLEKTFTDKQPYGKIHVNAGGGTNLNPVYRRTAELDPEALVIFTDLCVDIPTKPKWDTIWLIPELNCNVPADLNYGKLYLIPKE